MNRSDEKLWPALPLDEWEDTYHTLHMWTQWAKCGWDWRRCRTTGGTELST